MAFHIIRNDITKVKADAIVNTANPHPVYGGGTDAAIYEAAGKQQLLAAREKIGDIPRGQAVETPAFKLDAKYIIHTVGPKWEGGSSGEFEILRQCYENSLLLARKLHCRSVAFPLIATGVYGFPKDKALQIAMSVIQPFVMEHRMDVTLVVFHPEAFELSGRVVENVREYVDNTYVNAARLREYGIDRERRKMLPKEELAHCETDIPGSSLGISSAAATPTKKPAHVDIGNMLAAPDKTFQEKLFEIIDSRGLTGPQVYKNYISKQVYSKIQANKHYHPNKYTAIALCLSLHLSLEETLDLMGRAGWTLSPSSTADLVVRGCILNREYNIIQIDLILFDHGCPTLEKIK